MDERDAASMSGAARHALPGRYAEGALYWKPLPDGYEISVWQMLFNVRVCYGLQNDPCIIDAYCFPNIDLAMQAAVEWDGESPIRDGWTKNPVTGRTRRNGDPALEARNWELLDDPKPGP